MGEVRLAVGQTIEAAENRNLPLVLSKRLQLRRQVVVSTRFRGEPTNRRDAQAPEPGAEAHRERCAALCEQRAVTVEEAIEVRERYRDRGTLKQPAKDRSTLHYRTHQRTSRDDVSLGIDTWKNWSLVVMTRIKSRRR